MAESRYLRLPEISVAGLHNFLDAASGEGADWVNPNIWFQLSLKFYRLGYSAVERRNEPLDDIPATLSEAFADLSCLPGEFN
jgi:hypothetical protein